MDLVERLLTLGLANAAAAAVLALVVAFLSWVLARRPTWLHCLWLLVLLKLVTPPLFEIPIMGRDPGRVSEEPVTVPIAEQVVVPKEALAAVDVETDEGFEVAAFEQATQQEPFWPRWWRAWVPYLVIVWLLGSLGTLVLAAIRITRFHRLLRQAHLAGDEVQDRVRELGARLGLKRSPSVWWVDAPLAPLLWAVGCRPRLIVPLKLWKTLNEQQRSLLLVHELAHLRRGDHLLRLFELMVTALYWWLPVLWWARYALRDAEEQCCDAWVVWAFPDDSRTYAETLLDTVDFLNPSRSAEPLLVCGFGRAHHLRRRLTMIMLKTTPRRLGRGSALLAFGLSAALLPLTPSWAQKPAGTKPVQPEAIAVQFIDGAPKEFQEAKPEVQVSVFTAGELEEVKADSLSKAAELIKEQIEALAREKGKLQENLPRIKALKEALASLERVKAKTLGLRISTLNVAPEGLGLVARVPAHNDKLSAEMKAKLEKAKARLAVLKKEFEEKRLQLLKANNELVDLVALVEAAPTGRILVYSSPPGRVEQHRALVARLVPEAEAKTSDHDRLESLEKKLDKLLKEVASLRKRGEKAR